MNSRELAALIIQYASPVVNLLLAALFAKLALVATKYLRNETIDTLLSIVAKHVESEVAATEVSTVRDLKDPSKDGTWDEVAQKSVKTSVMVAVRAAVPGATAKAVTDRLLGGMVEKAVASLSTAVTPAVSIPPAAPVALAAS